MRPEQQQRLRWNEGTPALAAEDDQDPLGSSPSRRQSLLKFFARPSAQGRSLTAAAAVAAVAGWSLVVREGWERWGGGGGAWCA